MSDDIDIQQLAPEKNLRMFSHAPLMPRFMLALVLHIVVILPFSIPFVLKVVTGDWAEEKKEEPAETKENDVKKNGKETTKEGEKPKPEAGSDTKTDQPGGKPDETPAAGGGEKPPEGGTDKTGTDATKTAPGKEGKPGAKYPAEAVDPRKDDAASPDLDLRSTLDDETSK